MMEAIRFDALRRDVSRVALGTSSMGGGQWMGTVDEQAARDTIRRALALGLDVIDTAPAYGHGRAETFVGETLAELGSRDETMLVTKAGWRWEDGGRLVHDASRDGVRRQCEASLRRLRTDRIDLYLLHFPDPATPVAVTAEAFRELLDEGTVRAVGVCNLSVAQMREWEQHAPLHAVQDRYSLFDREVEPEVLPYCREREAVFLAYSPLARGMLTGAMRHGHEPTDAAHDAPKFHGEEYDLHLLAAERLADWAEQLYDKTLPELAVRWVLDRTSGIALWGTRRPEHLDPVPGVWGWRLDVPGFREADRIVAEALDQKAVRSAPVRRL